MLTRGPRNPFSLCDGNEKCHPFRFFFFIIFLRCSGCVAHWTSTHRHVRCCERYKKKLSADINLFSFFFFFCFDSFSFSRAFFSSLCLTIKQETFRAADEHYSRCYRFCSSMNDEKEETYPQRNDCHINIRTLKSTMLKEYNEIIHDDDDRRLNVHS
jgi:hypothetical protein